MNRLYRLFGISKTEQIAQAIRSFSLWQKLLWWICVFSFFGSMLVLIKNANEKFLVEVPARGGGFVEGIVGVPRFVNPILAASDADRDLTQLIYSGLVRVKTDGTLIPDLADKYEISEDGLDYTFTLKSDLLWHDGTPLTTEDIEFTIQKIQDPGIKSPRQASWKGIGIERLGDRIIRFHLKQPFAGFLENATIGIIPKHLWKDVDATVFPFSKFNTEAIGSGPYKIAYIGSDSSGIPRFYNLVPFSSFALGSPKIESIQIRFYSNEEETLRGLELGEIEAMSGLSPELIEKNEKPTLRTETSTLPRIFAVFFNQNQAPLFADNAVRLALDHALDKKTIVRDVLRGYGVAIDGPIPPGSVGFSGGEDISTSTPDQRLTEARAILEKAGWKMNDAKKIYEKTVKKSGKTTVTTELAFSLATGDAPSLKHPAELVKATWEKLGARVDLKVFEKSDLNQNIIRPRKYDALFFGEIVGRDPDLFSFWHSSQRNDPGLNIALYTSVKTDKLLDETRTASDIEERIELYHGIEDEIRADVPAVFLYSPQFLYLLPRSIKKTEMSSIVTNAERFSNIYQWYIATEKVWKLFLK